MKEIRLNFQWTQVVSVKGLIGGFIMVVIILIVNDDSSAVMNRLAMCFYVLPSRSFGSVCT